MPRSVDSLSENLDISHLNDRWHGEIVPRRRRPRSNGIANQDYLTASSLAEDVIVIRFIRDYRQLDNVIQYYIQIVWNSRFSWLQIMQYVEDDDSMYHFNFIPELINVGSRNIIPRSPREVVHRLPDVIIRKEDNENGNGNDDGVDCTVCYDTFKNGESVKQLACTHLFHSNCIVQWFCRKMNCPTCRYDVAPD